MITTKRVIILMILLLVSALLISLWVFTQNPKSIDTGESFNGLPIFRMSGTFIIDVDNPNELVGDSDFVFVAKVISQDGYEYRNHITKETEDGGMETIGDPYTNYSVDIIENIKGNLIMDEVIPIRKFGGLYEDGSGFALFEDDEFPVVGETYIFFANTDLDGALLVDGPNSNQKIDTPNNAKEPALEEIVDESEKVEEIEDAVDTQVVVLPRKHIDSIYEED
jgi:hypothetical protein